MALFQQAKKPLILQCYDLNIYFDSESKARTLFKHKYQMTENVRMNFKGDESFARTLWKCSHCLNQDSESHLLWCSEYEDFRQGLDLNNNSDLCSYLKEVFKFRCKDSNKYSLV